MRCVRHAYATFSIITALCVFSEIAAAQTTLYVLVDADGRVECGSSCQRQPTLWEIDVERAQIRSQIPLPSSYHTHHGLAATPDGRYLLWIGSDALSSPSVETLNVFDRLTRTSTEVLRRPMQPLVGAAWSPVIAHPTRLRVFAQLFSSPPPALDASGLTPLTAGAILPTMQNLTATGDAIVIRRTGGAVLLRTDTGAVIGEMAVAADAWAVNREGGELYSVKSDVPPFGTTGTIGFRRYDVTTGTLLRERIVNRPSRDAVRSLRVDSRTGHLFADLYGGGFEVLRADSLESLGFVTTGLLADGTTGRLEFEAHRARAYLLSTKWFPGNVFANSIDIIDTDTLTTIGGGLLPTTLAASAIVVVPRPPAPALSADIHGSRVTLQWTAGTGAGLATGFRLVAGSTSGASDLAMVDLGTASQLVIDGVPPGTYHVRVHATNFEGPSAPSNEVIVTVP